jgi:hypothetical protein
VTVRVRFADLRSVTRSVTLDAPISVTAILAEIAEELVRTVLERHPDEGSISLLSISVSHLEKDTVVQLELPLGLEDEGRQPGSKKGLARRAADHAVDKIRERFGWGAVGYGSVALGISIPFRTSFACSPNRNSDYAIRYFPKAHLCCSCRRGGARARGLTSGGTASVAA